MSAYVKYLFVGAKTVMSLRRALATDFVVSVADVAVRGSFILALLPRGEQGTKLQTLVYILVATGLAVGSPLNRLPAFSNAIYDGSYVQYHIRPQPLGLQFISLDVGAMTARFVVGTPFLAGAFLLYRSDLDGPTILVTVLMLHLGGVLASAISTLFYLATSFTRRDSGPRAILQGVSALMSGQLVPLTLWPDSASWVHHQPFAYVVDAPMRVMFGLADPAPIIGLQLLFAFILMGASTVIAEHTFHLREQVGA